MAPEIKQDNLQNKLENITFGGVSVDDAKKLKDFVEETDVDDTKIKEYLNGKTKEAISDNKEIKDALKLAYNSLPDNSEDKKELETLAVFLYGVESDIDTGKGNKTLAEDFRNIDKSSEEFKKFQEKSNTTPEDKKVDTQQKVDEEKSKITKQEKAEVKSESLNLPKAFKFYQTKIDGKYQSIPQEDINGLSALLANTQGGDKLIGLLNKGAVKEFQTKIGMTEKDSKKENNADGFFGVRTYNNLKAYADKNKKTLTDNPVETDTKEEVVIATTDNGKKEDITTDNKITTEKTPAIVTTQEQGNAAQTLVDTTKPADKSKTQDIDTDKSVEKKTKLEEAALKSSIINVEETIRSVAKNSDGSIDRKKVSTFGLNKGKFKLSSYSDEEFSKAINEQMLKDKQTIIIQNKGIKENDIDKSLQKSYKQKLIQMTKQDLPAGATLENYFSSANQTYNKITGAYMSGTYKSEGQDTNAYKIENDQDLGIDKEKEINTEELTTQEMKRASKDVIKFLNSESLSSQERREIRFFIRTVANIDRKNINDKPIEKDVLDYFASNPNSLSFTKEDRMKQNIINGLTIKESDARRLQKLNQLYYQAMNGQNQTLRRLFYIVSQEGSVADAKTSFNGSIETAKENEKQLKKETRKLKGEINSKAGTILNYQEKDLAEYQAYINQIEGDKSKEKVIINTITDFDLNGFVNHKDAGSKTGLQIQKIISDFGEKDALNNIIALANKIGEKSELTEKITKENLLSDPAYLLLVQNTLKNPAFDITDIVRHGDKIVENIYNLSNKSTESLNTQSDKVIDDLKKLGIPVEAGLKDIVSTSVLKAYNESAFGIGIPLDEFIKGLSFNVGSATVPTGLDSFGINIGRNGKTSLGKGREATGGVSGGTSLIFIPMGSFNLGVMKTFENKKQSTSLDIKTSKKFELSGHTIVMPGVLGYGGGVGLYGDKRESIKEQGPKLQDKLKTIFEEVLQPNKGKDKFEFNKTELIKKLGTSSQITFEDSKKDTLVKAVNNMALILAAYDGLSKDKIGEASAKIAESYANAWINQSALDINNKWYIGGAGLSVTFFEGIIPIVGILTLKKHRITSYNDIDFMTKLKSAQEGEGNEDFKGTIEELIKRIKTQSGTEIRQEGDDIIIPKSDKLQIKINQNMKGLVMINEKGELIVHKDTPIRGLFFRGSDRGTNELNIGDLQESKDEINRNKQSIPEDFKAKQKINPEELPVKIDPNTVNVNRILDNLKSQIKDNENNSMSAINAEVIGSTVIFKILDNEVGRVEEISNKSKITIKSEGIPIGNGISTEKLTFEKSEIKDQKRLVIEFIGQAETKKEETKAFDEIGENTNEIIQTIYNEGREIKDNLFHNIIHQTAGKKLAADYIGFNENLNSLEYTKAKENLISILDSIGSYKKGSFAKTRENLNKITDEYQLIKVLSAFNVLFSRVANVRIENGKYTYFFGDQPTTGERIIEENENRIKEGREYHKGGFTEQFKLYRPENSEDLTKENVDSLFAKIKLERTKKQIDFNQQEQTKNTISFNHGNPQDYFKLQINPEIVAGYRIKMDDLKDSTNEQFIENLKSSYINQLIQTEDKLLNGMLQRLGIEQELSIEQKTKLFSEEGLDIEGKKRIKVEYNQNYGYNPECNNLMRLMENLKINTVDETKKEQKYEAKLEGNGLAINYGETNSKVNMQEKRFSIAGGVAIRSDKQPTSIPGEEEVPSSRPGEITVPGSKPGETPGGTTTTPIGGPGQSGHENSGRD